MPIKCLRVFLLAGVPAFTIALSLAPHAGQGQIYDSTGLSFGEGNIDELSNYTEVRTHPRWADIRDKPVTATRWPNFNEITDKPTFYPTTWTQIDGKPEIYPTTWSEIKEKPERFAPEDHNHDGRYVGLSGSSVIQGDLTVTNEGVSTPGAFAVIHEGDGKAGDDITIMSYVDPTISAGPSFLTFRASGSEDFPDFPQNVSGSRTVSLGDLSAHGYDAENDEWVVAGRVFIKTEEDWSEGNMPAKLSFHTKPASGSVKERMVIDSEGNVGIGTQSPRQTLDVAGGAIIGIRNTDHPEWYGGVLAGREGYSQKNSPLAGTGYIDTPWVYARAIEADARGNTSTLIALGNNNGYTDHDQIGFVTGGELQVSMSSQGTGSNFRMGIGTDSPSAVLHVEGDVLADNYGLLSDQRLKENIEPIEGSLGSLSALKGVRFTWKDDAKPSGDQIGLIAQDVEGVFPELVSQGEGAEYLIVNYDGLIAPLVNAVNELNERTGDIEHLQEQVAFASEAIETVSALEARIGELERMLEKALAEK